MPSDFTSRPTLPIYRDKKDFAVYLLKFERVVQLLGLKTDTYTVRFGCHLTRKAVELYTSLSTPSVTKAYQLLKQALLTGFSKTPDGYHVDFRSTKIKVGKNYHQFAMQHTRFFEAWTESSEVVSTYEDLKEIYDP